MKSRLLWDRFLSHWLPPDERTGDVERDVDRALERTYVPPNATFSQKGGLSVVVIAEERTEVASRIPPCVPLPSWLVEIESSAAIPLLNRAIRDLLAAPRPHIVLKTGKRPFALDGIVPGGGAAVVVNEPDGAWVIDSVRIDRARRALRVLGSVNGAKQARKLLADRIEAMGDTDEIDKKLRATVRRLKTDEGAFFDALDLLEGATDRELRIAGERR